VLKGLQNLTTNVQYLGEYYMRNVAYCVPPDPPGFEIVPTAFVAIFALNVVIVVYRLATIELWDETTRLPRSSGAPPASSPSETRCTAPA
jgi:hypothetical protein